MSDTEEGFDKEAERQKLREQLRREEEDRRSTQHMSELLLKGATMTNKHCETCGDPLFRYEGREFCPTCGREGAGVTTATAEAADDAEMEATVDRVETGTLGGETAAGTATGVEQGVTADADGPADLEAARASLVRTLASLARRAEETGDVGRARELLAAAREAAEALAAMDAAGR